MMASGHRVRARITLDTTARGGLKSALSSGTRSLLLQFQRALESNEPIMLGAVITSENQARLAPGVSDLTVSIHFWNDAARTVALPHVSFVVWYGRKVGHGEILDVVRHTPP
jgi:hypothetical protein